jgi:putative glutamine amidotransferase
MRPRIAIPFPHSTSTKYGEQAFPQYAAAVEMAGAEAVCIPLDKPLPEVSALIASCDGVVLPGSSADVDPAKFHAERHPKTEPADPARDVVDEMLLNDAYKLRKPVLGICYGLQILNVHQAGTLRQHIESPVNHEAGRKVPVAHTAEIEPQSLLARIIKTDGAGTGGKPAIPVNSSHHQSAEVIGEGLRVVARCPDDGVIEAVEGTAPDHFVLAVQWHPERSTDDERSRAIFQALVEAAKTRKSSAGSHPDATS